MVIVTLSVPCWQRAQPLIWYLLPLLCCALGWPQEQLRRLESLVNFKAEDGPDGSLDKMLRARLEGLAEPAMVCVSVRGALW